MKRFSFAVTKLNDGFALTGFIYCPNLEWQFGLLVNNYKIISIMNDILDTVVVLF